jgi:transposase-like protein
MRKVQKLTKEQREEAVRLAKETDMTLKEVAEMFGVSFQNIHCLLNSKKRKGSEGDETNKVSQV